MLLLPADNDPSNLKENGNLVGLLPEGSNTHTYTTMSHGYMSRGLLVPDALGDTMFKGTHEDVSAVQADALKRTISFMMAAVERPPVLPSAPTTRL
jgi:hypothetical protein